MRKISLIIVALLLVQACQQPVKSYAEISDSCERLNRLMYSVRQVDRALNQKKEWPEIEPLLEESLVLMKTNLTDSSAQCRFQDHEYYPLYARFIFSDDLSTQIMRGNYPEAFSYLIQFGELYSGDAEISEYFSEKLAMIAYHNTEVWYRYYENHPDKRDSLIHNTRWKIMEKSRMSRRLKQMKHGDDILKKIESNKGWARQT